MLIANFTHDKQGIKLYTQFTRYDHVDIIQAYNKAYNTNITQEFFLFYHCWNLFFLILMPSSHLAFVFCKYIKLVPLPLCHDINFMALARVNCLEE